MNTSFVGPVLAFVGVIALIPVALWLLKRTPLGASASGPGGMRVVSALALAPNQRLVTVEVGQGPDRQWLVLGVSPGGIRTLHTLPPQADARLTAHGPGSGTGVQGSAGPFAPFAPFAQLLARQQRQQAAPQPGPGEQDAR